MDNVYKLLKENWHNMESDNSPYLNKRDEFIQYCLDELSITRPQIKFIENRDDVDVTTGCYIPDVEELYVYVKNRALCDILRTVAHELVHHKQKIENRLPSSLTERNKEIEDEANCIAGDLVYNFAHLNENNMCIYDL